MLGLRGLLVLDVHCAGLAPVKLHTKTSSAHKLPQMIASDERDLNLA
jgi:hypothetical protein